jgi:hypothetical protein
MVELLTVQLTCVEVLDVVLMALHRAAAKSLALVGEEPLFPYERFTEALPTDTVTVPKS